MNGTIRLSPQQTTALNNARRVLAEVAPDIAKLEACGTDCTDLRKQWETYNQQLSKIVEHFGANPQ
jgi:hypothetical protein